VECNAFHEQPLGTKVSYSVVLYRFHDGRLEQPGTGVERLGAFSNIQLALDEVFPGRRWSNDEFGWRSDPWDIPEVRAYFAPEDHTQVMCSRIWDAATEQILALSSRLNLLAWDPEGTRILVPEPGSSL
jgi:hypothetical protein